MFNYDEALKLQQAYLPGTRIQLEEKPEGSESLSEGEKGTVEFVDDAGIMFVEWDNGEKVAINPNQTKIKRLSIDDQILEAEEKKAEIIAEKQRKRGRRGHSNEHQDDLDRD